MKRELTLVNVQQKNRKFEPIQQHRKEQATFLVLWIDRECREWVGLPAHQHMEKEQTLGTHRRIGLHWYTDYHHH